ncbi:hypothetical protein GCM10028778_26700 [Barrientosiimonas marina]
MIKIRYVPAVLMGLGHNESETLKLASNRIDLAEEKTKTPAGAKDR